MFSWNLYIFLFMKFETKQEKKMMQKKIELFKWFLWWTIFINIFCSRIPIYNKFCKKDSKRKKKKTLVNRIPKWKYFSIRKKTQENHFSFNKKFAINAHAAGDIRYFFSFSMFDEETIT